MEAASGLAAEKLLTAPDRPCAALADQFDLGAILEFSGAVPIWESAVRTGRRPAQSIPQNQKLFHGTTDAATHYFNGIRKLALRNAPQLFEALSARRVQFGRVLDLGAGTGDYAAAMIDRGIARDVLCVDQQYVIDLPARQRRSSLRWQAADLRRLSLPSEEPFDAVWISNVLHHYSARTDAEILRRCARNLASDGSLLIHEYLLDGAGTQALAAGVLGLHFALTTGGGRCYSLQELLDLCARATPFNSIEFSLTLPISTVVILRRG
ncbi:MAG: class I SAM-dependent methyltransferase [Deltaproteobacteria bacterium]|nr:class I SAM-dependent methyltransferase [Deltaproteobacteria bacterium]